MKPLAQAAGLGWRGKHTNLGLARFVRESCLNNCTILPASTSRDGADAGVAARAGLPVASRYLRRAAYKLDAQRCISI